jgi:hypothetical protein
MLWDIDLNFGIWVYNDELQIKFTFRSGTMIFGRVMALGLWNFAKYLVVTKFFRCAWRYWLDFLYLSVYWWVTDHVYISFRSNDFWPSYVLWTVKLGQIFSCHHLFFAMLGDIDLIFCIWVRPKIIGPERNVNLICNSLLYTHIQKIKSISPSIAKNKWWQLNIWPNFTVQRT